MVVVVAAEVKPKPAALPRHMAVSRISASDKSRSEMERRKSISSWIFDSGNST